MNSEIEIVGILNYDPRFFGWVPPPFQNDAIVAWIKPAAFPESLRVALVWNSQETSIKSRRISLILTLYFYFLSVVFWALTLNLKKNEFSVLSRNIVAWITKCNYIPEFCILSVLMIHFYPVHWSCDRPESVNKLHSCEQLGDQLYT